MKTIAELAREIGVTKPAVRRYLTENVRQQFSETISGVIYISEQGEALIKSKFLKNKEETEKTNDSENISANETETVSGVSDTVSALISMLQKELEIKNKQLEVKDNQIEELTATIKIQAQSINAARHNELAETIIPQLSGAKKGNIFSRFFSKGRHE